MPKKTFLNLKPAKKERILKAAKEEFVRVPLPKVSINNIIKGANIPRGSFYQYFDGVEDLYYYIYDQITISRINETDSILEEVGYDIFKIYDESIKRQYDEYMDVAQMTLYSNLNKGLDECEEWDRLRKENFKKRDAFLVKVMNRNDFIDKSDENMIFIIKFLKEIKRIVIQKAMNENLTLEQTDELYWKYANIIRQGTLKK